MYTGRVACCLLLSHVEYVPRAQLKLEKKMRQTERQIDGWTPDRYITLTARRGLLKNSISEI